MARTTLLPPNSFKLLRYFQHVSISIPIIAVCLGRLLPKWRSTWAATGSRARHCIRELMMHRSGGDDARALDLRLMDMRQAQECGDHVDAIASFRHAPSLPGFARVQQEHTLEPPAARCQQPEPEPKTEAKARTTATGKRPRTKAVNVAGVVMKTTTHQEKNRMKQKTHYYKKKVRFICTHCRTRDSL